MLTADELLALAKHYRTALLKIREDTITFTREWRLANDALQKAPKPPTTLQCVEGVQLEMTFMERRR